MPEFIEGQPIRSEVSNKEIGDAFAVAAPGANKFVINIGTPGVRMAFGEVHQQLDSPTFHTAVTLHPLDAIKLYKILKEMLAPIEETFRASGAITDSTVEGANNDG